MNPIYKISIYIGLCLLGMSSTTYAQMYKWVDEDGVTQYSQLPPLNQTEVETIDVPKHSLNASAIKNLDSQIKRANSLREMRLEAMKLQQIEEENEARKLENCRRSQARMASYSVPNALILQADGSRTRVDEETRLKELVTSEELINKYCN